MLYCKTADGEMPPVARRRQQAELRVGERALIVLLTAAVVAMLVNYLPLLRRAIDSTEALEAAREESELPSIYYTKHSAGFDDSLVSFSDDTEPQKVAAAAAAAAGAGEFDDLEPHESDRISEEDRTFWQDAVA